MTTIRPFRPTDLLRFNSINLDPMTETYGVDFYIGYLINFPEYYQVAEHPNGELMGYLIGKVEGETKHGHVSVLSVASQFRRLEVAKRMMDRLEQVSDRHRAFFVDLFVRQSNELAIEMYERRGYIAVRRVTSYYNETRLFPEEGAYDMHKALAMDVHHISEGPLRDIHVNDL